MIVKDEEAVLAGCLASVKPFIDYWVISDTGSKDRTKEIVQESLAGIPGQLLSRPWVNFGHNRNEAVREAEKHADYVMVIDADERLHGTIDKAALTADGYRVKLRYPEMVQARTLLVTARTGWKYIGVVHEFLDKEPRTADFLYTAHLEHLPIPPRRNDAQFQWYLEMLLPELRQRPENARTQFYVAQTYMALREPARALQHFKQRIHLGGWDEETWLSLLQIAKCHQVRGDSPSVVIDAFLKAYEFRPSRAETLFSLCDYLQSKNMLASAMAFGRTMLEIPYPAEDILFVQHHAYDWQALDMMALIAYRAKHFHEALEWGRRALEQVPVVHSSATRIKDNMSWYQKAVDGKHES